MFAVILFLKELVLTRLWFLAVMAAALGFVTFQLPEFLHVCSPILVPFFLAYQRDIHCFPKKLFVLIGPNVIEILEITMEAKNQNVQILTN